MVVCLNPVFYLVGLWLAVQNFETQYFDTLVIREGMPLEVVKSILDVILIVINDREEVITSLIEVACNVVSV